MKERRPERRWGQMKKCLVSHGVHFERIFWRILSRGVTEHEEKHSRAVHRPQWVKGKSKETSWKVTAIMQGKD